jgi:hypothetical protein
VHKLHDDNVAELLDEVVSDVEQFRLGVAGRRGAADATTA